MTLPIVERVARAMHPRTWEHFLHHAERALEASHHAEALELLRSIRAKAEIAERETPYEWRGEWAAVGISIDKHLAKIGEGQ
jgi:hypothetical protein